MQSFSPNSEENKTATRETELSKILRSIFYLNFMKNFNNNTFFIKDIPLWQLQSISEQCNRKRPILLEGIRC